MGWLSKLLLWLVILSPWLALLVLVLWDVTRPPSNARWVRPDKISFATLVFNVATLFGAAVGVVVAAYAYNEARRQADIADDRSKIEQRGQLVDVTNSWHVNRLNDAIGPIVSFSLHNPGRTPAYVLHGTYEAYAGVDLPQQFAGPPRQIPRLPRILRQDQKSLVVISEHLPSADAIAVDEGKQFYYVRIIIVYQDIFHTSYEFRSTAKYGRIVDADGNPVKGVEFPEEYLRDDLWKAQDLPDRFQYNSHRRLGE